MFTSVGAALVAGVPSRPIPLDDNKKAFVSDRKKGLLQAQRTNFPNLKKLGRCNEAGLLLFDKMAYARTEAEFDDYYDETNDNTNKKMRRIEKKDEEEDEEDEEEVWMLSNWKPNEAPAENPALAAGDEIYYYNEVFTCGDPRGERTTFVTNVDLHPEDSNPNVHNFVTVANAEVLPNTQLLKRISTMTDGVRVTLEGACFISLRKYNLKAGKLNNDVKWVFLLRVKELLMLSRRIWKDLRRKLDWRRKKNVPY